MAKLTGAQVMTTESKMRVIPEYAASDYEIGNTNNITGFTIATRDGSKILHIDFDALVKAELLDAKDYKDAEWQASYKKWLVETFVAIHEDTLNKMAGGVR